MSRKLLVCILTAVLLSVMLLSACAPGSAPSSAAQPPADGNQATAAPVNPATQAPAEISGKITVWCWNASWTKSIVASGALDAFQAKYPNVQIDYVETSPTDLYQKLPIAISAGTGAPDFACVESSHLAQLVALGGLSDLTAQVTPYLDKMNAYKWADTMADGKYYAMPWDSGPVVMYYRRDVFKAAGLASDPDSVSALVATWDDYLNVCKTIMAKTGDQCFASNKANNDARIYEIMLWQQGLGYTNVEGQVTVDSPENAATLEVLKKFWDADLLSDQQAWTDGWYGEFSAGGTAPVATVGPGTPEPPAVKPVASLVEAAWMGAFLKGFIAPGTEGLWGVAQMPAMKMLPVLQRIWRQMHEPKWWISMGACASTGGVFDTYSVVQGIDRFMPVDVYVPGCPPGPETLMHAILTLHQKIKDGELTKRREPGKGAGLVIEQRDGQSGGGRDGSHRQSEPR